MKSINFKIIKINISEETETRQTLWDKDENSYFYNRNLVTNQKVVGYNQQKKALTNKFKCILKNSWYTGGLSIALNQEDRKLTINDCEIMPEYVYIYTKDGDTIADASIVFENFIIIMRLTQKKLTETSTSI